MDPEEGDRGFTPTDKSHVDMRFLSTSSADPSLEAIGPLGSNSSHGRSLQSSVKYVLTKKRPLQDRLMEYSGPAHITLIQNIC